jgi:hypothetical protein
MPKQTETAGAANVQRYRAARRLNNFAGGDRSAS